MIEVRNLTKRFDEAIAVDNLSFKVETGQTLALIGSSGSGKTTTLRMINRLIEPDSGQILVNGEEVTYQPIEQMRRRMGYVIQNMGLFPHYTVEENVAVVPTLLKWKKPRIRERVHTLLEQIGLPPDEYAEKYPEQLSGGQQQRVGLARALAADPPIILMDEPFGALDPVTRLHIRREVLQLEEFADKTIIIVTHDVEEAFEMGSLICLLDKGEMQQLGEPKDLLQHPANEYVASFFAGQKLQLELMIYTLKDVFEQWPKQPMGQNGITISANTSLKIALDTVNEQANDVAMVEINGDRRYFNIPILMNAQQQLNNQ
ncbi:MAG: ATP-binding cassette domain-containing protein [Saprospiraceae bacterium]|nr:ATP-binding cassette domain-containing protein [Saprospiraceae bacterium]